MEIMNKEKEALVLDPFFITKWCKSITDDKKDWYINKGRSRKLYPYTFRLLDDDGCIYGYGVSINEDFEPLDNYRDIYGCTEIQYKNKETGKYKTL